MVFHVEIHVAFFVRVEIVPDGTGMIPYLSETQLLILLHLPRSDIVCAANVVSEIYEGILEASFY